MTKLSCYCLLCVALFAGNSHAQSKKATMSNNPKSNPLLCEPEKGVCDMPGATNTAITNAPNPKTKPVRIVYFTDPICSSCWGVEPQLRKLSAEYGDFFEIEYRMGGLLPSWDVYNSGGISKPSDVAHHWDEVSAHYDMPIDGDVWLEDPLPSSYPPSIAFKAAQLQDPKKALQFLRRIREMVFLEKKNITKWEHLQNAAMATGLDAQKMKQDLEGKAKQLFQEDLDMARRLGVRGFPTLFFTDTLNQQLMIYGARPYPQFEQNILYLCPEAAKKQLDNTPESWFSRYPTLTTKEFSVLTGTSKVQAEKILSDLFEQKKLDKHTSKNGPLWKKIH